MPRPLTRTKWRRGDVHPVTGLLFVEINNGYEYWVTPEKLAELRAAEAAQAKVWRTKNKERAAFLKREWERKNPEKLAAQIQRHQNKRKAKTAEKRAKREAEFRSRPKFKRGDVGDDGLIFWCYVSKTRRNGARHTWERWKTPEEVKRYNQMAAKGTVRWNKLHPDQRRAIKMANYHKNLERSRARLRAYYLKNRDKHLAAARLWRQKNADKVRIEKRKYRKARYQRDPVFRIKSLVAWRLRNFLRSRNVTKRNRTFQAVGCTPEFLKLHLEAQFRDGMAWENQRLWQIDHRTPLASAKTEAEILALCHYTNLQPLWAFDNLSKGAKMSA